MSPSGYGGKKEIPDTLAVFSKLLPRGFPCIPPIYEGKWTGRLKHDHNIIQFNKNNNIHIHIMENQPTVDSFKSQCLFLTVWNKYTVWKELSYQLYINIDEWA